MAPFLQSGITKMFFLPTIASSTKAPTVAEIAAGEDLTDPNGKNLPLTIEGFTSETQFIEIETFAAKDTLKMTGRKNAADSNVEFLEDNTTNPTRTLLEEDASGFLVFSANGEMGSGDPVDVFPVVVGSNTRPYSAGNEPSKFRVSFGITGIPVKDIAVLA